MTLQDIDLKYQGGTLTSNAPFALNAGLTVAGAAITGPNTPQPADHGLIAWVDTPTSGTSGTTTVTGGTLYLSAVFLRQAATVSKLWCAINSAGVTPTANENWLGLYSSAGALLGSVVADSIVTANGPHGLSITPVAATAGFYWVGQLWNAGTSPGVARSQAATFSNNNVNLATAALRFAVNGTGLTTLPGSITPASNSTTGAAALWAAVS